MSCLVEETCSRGMVTELLLFVMQSGWVSTHWTVPVRKRWNCGRDATEPKSLLALVGIISAQVGSVVLLAARYSCLLIFT